MTRQAREPAPLDEKALKLATRMRGSIYEGLHMERNRKVISDYLAAAVRQAPKTETGGDRALQALHRRWVNAEYLARAFHEAYERLAPDHDYQTRSQSAKPWALIPAENRDLMVSVCAELLARAETGEPTPDEVEAAAKELHPVEDLPAEEQGAQFRTMARAALIAASRTAGDDRP